jgi:hypothetical protein
MCNRISLLAILRDIACDEMPMVAITATKILTKFTEDLGEIDQLYSSALQIVFAFDLKDRKSGIMRVA